jgi:hypothetical protein
MHALSQFLRYTITVPLLALPIIGVAPKVALAEISSPVQALELLAKRKEIDAKCHRLSPGERQELSDYVARAELAVVRRHSVADAQAAITIGKAKGAAAACDEAALSRVRETLSAARRALAGSPEPAAESEGGLVIEAKTSLSMRPSLVEPETSAPPTEIEKPKLEAVVEQPKKHRLLERYRAAATAYYVERRCGHLPRREAQQFWNLIVERHNEVLARNKRRAVAATLQSALAEANTMMCGARSAALVRQEYAAVRAP